MSIGVLIFDLLFIILGGISLYYNKKEKDDETFGFNIKLLEGFLVTFIVATVIFLLIRNNAKYYGDYFSRIYNNFNCWSFDLFIKSLLDKLIKVWYNKYRK